MVTKGYKRLNTVEKDQTPKWKWKDAIFRKQYVDGRDGRMWSDSGLTRVSWGLAPASKCGPPFCHRCDCGAPPRTAIPGSLLFCPGVKRAVTRLEWTGEVPGFGAWANVGKFLGQFFLTAARAVQHWGPCALRQNLKCLRHLPLGALVSLTWDQPPSFGVGVGSE